MNKLGRFILVLGILCSSFATYAQPVFKGGGQALENFLKEHIIYPEFSSKNCISASIKVSFRVDKTGKVTNVKTNNGLGIDLDDEAIRVVKMTSGKWTLPAGIAAANYLLPIRFTPDYSHCSTATPMSIEQAITQYKARQELENAVTNYYENKYAGKADTTKQSYIDALKQQLGFDDELIDDVLKQASAKLKQGDTDGACTDWKFIRNIGSDKADGFIARYCK
ncbi:MAG: TonB family protein [Bacteroidota bacterium]